MNKYLTEKIKNKQISLTISTVINKCIYREDFITEANIYFIENIQNNEWSSFVKTYDNNLVSKIYKVYLENETISTTDTTFTYNNSTPVNIIKYIEFITELTKSLSEND